MGGRSTLTILLFYLCQHNVTGRGLISPFPETSTPSLVGADKVCYEGGSQPEEGPIGGHHLVPGQGEGLAGRKGQGLRPEQVMLLSGQMLPPSDPAGLAARQTSVPAGLIARKRRERKLLVGQLDWLKDQVITWGMRRAVLLYRFQLSMLDAGGEEQLDGVVDQMARLGDKGLVMMDGPLGSRGEEVYHMTGRQ